MCVLILFYSFFLFFFSRMPAGNFVSVKADRCEFKAVPVVDLILSGGLFLVYEELSEIFYKLVPACFLLLLFFCFFFVLGFFLLEVEISWRTPNSTL